MKITLRAAGLIKSGPEREMIDDYLRRANGLGRGLGIPSVTESAIDLRGAKTRKDETEALCGGYPATDIFIALDERGKSMTSRKIAQQFAAWRDDGRKSVVITIGGADGFEQSALPAGTVKWSFGTQTWPHKLVRVMLAEQIYRALTIMAGTPYHRD